MRAKRVKPTIVNLARSPKQKANDALFSQRASAKLTASFRKPKPPSESWWALGLTREQFQERAETEFRARLVGFGVSENNTN
jgi:hypothetical protein